MGLSNAGLEAQLAALQAGAGTGEAKIAGQIRSKLFELAPAMNNVDPTIKAEAEAGFKEYVKLLNERLTLEQAIQAELDKRKDKPKGKQDALEAAYAELALQREILGAEGARRAGVELLGQAYLQYTPEQIRLLGEEKVAVEAIIAAQQQQIDLANTIAESFSDSFMSIVDGTATVKDAFRDMALDIVKHLFKVLVMQQSIKAIGNSILMGEAGPEAIMPLKRGPDGKLGVATTSNSQSVTVVQNINVSTGVQQTVRAEVMGLMPQIAAASKAAVLDAKRRGGSFGGSFR
jgi:hypothetical protein